MKKMILRVLSMALCAAMLCLPGLAAQTEGEAEPAVPAPVQVWGRATWQSDGSLLLENSDQNDPNREIVLHLGDAPVVDAVTGLPMAAQQIKDGDTVYAWVGPAMTMSLPPQAAAEVVVANIPADAAAPQYVQIARVEPRVTIAIYPPPPVTLTELVTTGGEKLTVTVDAELTPWLTKQMVTLESLVPGSRLLVWKDNDGTVTRVVLFAYEYQGYLSWEETGEVFLDDQYISRAKKAADGEALLPIRAVAEAAGYEVDWVPGQGAVVSQAGGGVVLSVLPGQAIARTAQGEMGLSGACLYEAGVTYLPAADLANLLNLFPAV